MKRTSKRILSIILLLALLLLPLNSAFGGVANSITSLNASYNSSTGLITISGEFMNDGTEAIAYQVIRPNGDVLYFGTMLVIDKLFGEDINVGAIPYGTYTIKAADFQGGEYFTTTFTYSSTPYYIPIPKPVDEGWIEPSDKLDEFYNDIPLNLSWAIKAINFLTDRGIVQGIGNSKFGPNLNFKRGDIMLMAINAFKVSGDLGESFDDVPESMYYSNAIRIARAMGIAKGDGENFRPEDSVTREDAIVLLFRTLEILNIELPILENSMSITSFGDNENVSDYARKAMNAFIKAGFVKGDGINLHPKSNISRAEMATILYRVMEFIEKNLFIS